MKTDKSSRLNSSDLESTISALRRLSPQSRELVVPLIRRLAEREGISVSEAKAKKPILPAEQGNAQRLTREAYGTRLSPGKSRSAAWGSWGIPRLEVLCIHSVETGIGLPAVVATRTDM